MQRDHAIFLIQRYTLLATGSRESYFNIYTVLVNLPKHDDMDYRDLLVHLIGSQVVESLIKTNSRRHRIDATANGLAV